MSVSLIPKIQYSVILSFLHLAKQNITGGDGTGRYTWGTIVSTAGSDHTALFYDRNTELAHCN